MSQVIHLHKDFYTRETIPPEVVSDCIALITQLFDAGQLSPDQLAAIQQLGVRALATSN